jgi:ferredoxin/flavodoxin
MIFYFSGTGNTRWAAERLAAETQERLLFIPEEAKTKCEYTLADDERIGFCFPVHGWQPPHVVRQFVDRLTITNAAGHYAYALCTCGDSTGLAMQIFGKELAEKGIELQSCQSLIMPESYVCLPFMKTDPEEKEAMKIDVARHQLPHIINIIKECRRGIEQLDKGPMPGLFSYVIGEYFNKKMVHDKKFTVNADKCIQCGKCQKVCPVNNIQGTPPVWLHNGRCTSCLACYHYCPVHAINNGKITRKRDQYYFNKRGDQR